jgi:hypothetical protein
MGVTLTVQSPIDYAVRMDQMKTTLIVSNLLAFAIGHLEGRICGGRIGILSIIGQLEIS